jgi:predicted AAA+ superfamily ATPase
LPELVYRREIGEIEEFLDSNFVQIVKGPRRSGKSSLLKLVYRKLLESVDKLSFLFLNLEDVSLSMEEKTPVLLEKLYRLYRQRVNPDGKTYMFVDEIQGVRRGQIHCDRLIFKALFQRAWNAVDRKAHRSDSVALFVRRLCAIEGN